jgi:predicted negative regulator of RcsB-dependent stress response
MREKITTISFAIVMLIALLSATTYGQYGQVTTPRVPSPAAMVSQTIGISTVTVKYSRPSVKGREIWGKLVPYGWNVQPFGAGNSAPWRAGANENTVIELSHDAKVEGQPVPAGAYGLTFVINKDNTGEVILSKDYQSWGSFFYDPKQDELRAKIQVRDIPMTEMLTYDFMNDTKTSSELVLNWEKKQFPVKIEFDVDKIVMDNAAKELKGATGFNDLGFRSAAVYAQQNNVNLDKGLTWIDQAIAQNNNFTNLSVKSNILKQMGKTEEADKIMKDAIVMSTENELNLYGYQLINTKDFDKAIEVLTLNTKRFPKSPNTFDSLGEAYALKGDKKNAIINFKKSLSMNPPANVKANSEKYLQQLGAM